MSYSCTDFTDEILRALAITVQEEDRNDPDMQAVMACDEIQRLQAVEQNQIHMRSELAGLLAAIKKHWDGDEQDLDVIADGLIKDFGLEKEVEDATITF
jgi:hypothetical protein